jgi:hypothetical protein
MGIDCRQCDTRGVTCQDSGVTCQDCVVTVLAPRDSARHLGAEEMRALRVLADAGMVPPGISDRLGLNAGPVSLQKARAWAFPATKAS